MAQERSATQVVHARVIFYLTERYQVGHPVVNGRYQFLPDVIKLLPVAVPCPMTNSLRQVLLVLLEAVVTSVEEVFAIQFDQRQ